MKYLLINGTLLNGFSKIENCALLIDDNTTIFDVFRMKRYKKENYGNDVKIIDVKGSYITPGLIDTHIHGIGGYGTEDYKEESILKMSEVLAQCGVTSFLPTVYTSNLENMIAAIKAIKNSMGKEKGAIIEGINVEGPFISPVRVGAQDPEGVQAVSTEVFNKLYEAGGGKIICMTVAPEIKHMRSIALNAQKKGIVLLAGHTNATYENMLDGMQCGIMHTTHFFNAMSRLHHRNPGCVGAVLMHSELKAEIIPDGVHVHPELVRLLINSKPLSNIVVVTDSLSPTMQKEGPFVVNGVKAKMKDGAFVSESDENLFMGSALTMIKGIKNLVSWGINIENAIQMATSNPADIYNFYKKGALIPGHYANIAVISKDLDVEGVFIKGKIVKDFEEDFYVV